VVCLNDEERIRDIGALKETIDDMLEKKFPEKSAFEI
jgi:hypothetical protein